MAYELNNNPLHLDQIITSQPELGPSAPDGGYGWIILLACVFIQLAIPSLLASYGTYLLFDQIENLEPDNEYLLWDHEITLVPIVFVAFWTLADSWCFALVSKFQWPKLTVFCATCLICGGNLIVYAAELHEPTIILFYFIAGALTGIGTSIIMQQCEYLIRQYFQHKYKVAKNILYLSNIIGFILTPLIMGKLIVRHGVLESVLGYQIILAQVCLVALVFKQPVLAYPDNKTYTLLDSSSCEDENLVFDKVVIEVQPSTSNEDSKSVIPEKSKQLTTFKQPDTTNTIKINQQLNGIDRSNQSEVKTRIRQSFAEEYKNDLDRNFEPTDENVSFSFDQNLVYNSTAQVVPNSALSSLAAKKQSQVRELIDELAVLAHSTIFYKFLLLIFVEKLSILVFWTLYPSILYDEVNLLNVHTTIMCITFVAIGGLVFTVFWNCFQIPRTTIKIFLSISFFVASLGFTIIHSARGKNWLVFGGILSTASLSSIHVLTETFILQNKDGINNNAHKIVNLIVGTTIFTTVFLDIEYEECFEAVSLLQFVVASLWLSNVLYKKVKKLFV